VLNPLVDVLAIETIPCLAEARALVRVLDATPDAQAWVSFSCADASHVCGGETIDECVEAVLSSPSVLAVGINCVAPGHGRALVERIAAQTERPVVIYPNAGERYEEGGWTGTATDPDAFALLARAWVEAGARIVGGCCRTGPQHVAALAKALHD